MNPIVVEKYSDNGQHSHWSVINADDGEVIIDDLEAIVSFPKLQIEKETDKMTYKILKTVSVKSVEGVCIEAGMKLALWAMKQEDNWKYEEEFLPDDIDRMPVEFWEWLIKRGFIKEIEEFEPFTVEVEVGGKKDLLELWHRLNMGTNYFSGYIKERGIEESVFFKGGAVSRLYDLLDRKLNKKC